ncbi:MAG: hypothetical protein ACC628_24760, partial [Pirellulaceae bacterium]
MVNFIPSDNVVRHVPVSCWALVWSGLVELPDEQPTQSIMHKLTGTKTLIIDCRTSIDYTFRHARDFVTEWH